MQANGICIVGVLSVITWLLLFVCLLLFDAVCRYVVALVVCCCRYRYLQVPLTNA